MWWVLPNSFTASGSWEKDPAAIVIPPQREIQLVNSSLKDPWEGETWEGIWGSLETPGKMHELVPIDRLRSQGFTWGY